MLGLRQAGAARVKQWSAIAVRRLQHAHVTQVQNGIPDQVYATFPLRKSRQQEYLHGPVDWAKQLTPVEIKKRCGPEDFTLEVKSPRLSISPRNFFIMLPAIPPWWAQDEMKVPEHVKELYATVQSGDWTAVARCVDAVVTNPRSRTSPVSWEFLMWQAVRLVDLSLAKQLLAACRQRHVSLPARLQPLLALILRRAGNKEQAMAAYAKIQESACSPSLALYVTTQMLELCNRTKEQQLVLECFSIHFKPRILFAASPPIASFEQFPKTDILRLAFKEENLTLLVALAASYSYPERIKLIVQVAPHFLSSDKFSQFLSDIISNEVRRSEGHVNSAMAYWKQVSKLRDSKDVNKKIRDFKFSLESFGLLTRALLKMKKLDFDTLLQLFSEIDRLDYAHASEADICHVMNSVGKLQVLLKNRITCGEPLNAHAWNICYQKLFPIDVFGLLKWHDVRLNLSILPTMYALQATDQRNGYPRWQDGTTAGGFPYINEAFWSWQFWVPSGVHPLPAISTFDQVLSDLRKLNHFQRIDTRNIMRVLSTGQAKNSLEAQFAVDTMTMQMVEYMVDSATMKMNVSRLIGADVNLLEFVDLIISMLVRKRVPSFPAAMLEALLGSVLPQNPTVATAQIASFAERLWSTAKQKPGGFVPTSTFLHFMLICVSKHRPTLILELLHSYTDFQLKVQPDTIFILAKSAAMDDWQVVRADDFLSFGIKNGVTLTNNQLAEIHGLNKKSAFREASGLQRMKMMIDVLQSRVERRPRLLANLMAKGRSGGGGGGGSSTTS